MTDRRFGTGSKFGTWRTFGASSTRTALGWGVEVDWDGDGLFSGSNEASRMTGISIDRGRKRYLQPRGAGFETIQTGRLIITLDNASGRYDAYNTASPLYPYVSYGKDIKITVRDMATGTIYPMFYGVISDIAASGYGSNAIVTIYAEDGWAYLRNNTARVAIQTSTTPDAAIGYILDDIKWPARWGRSLDVSSDNIPYWWASGSKIAGSEIQDVSDSFVGYFFINASGQAQFIIRSNASASVANFDQSVLLKDIRNPQPWEISRNITRIKIHPRTTSPANSTLYQLLGNAPSIETGASNAYTFFANYTYSNQSVPASSITAPVATTDYTTNTAADGSGTDKTANCTVTATSLGDVAKVIVTNTSGVTVYLTKCNIRGTAIYEQNSADITYPSDPSTVTAPREFKLDLLWQQNGNTATDLTAVMGAYLSGNHPTPMIQIENRPDLAFVPDLFDIVISDIPAIGINGVSFRVGGIEHRSTNVDNCQSMLTKIYLEPYISATDFMIWDTASTWDTLTVFGW